MKVEANTIPPKPQKPELESITLILTPDEARFIAHLIAAGNGRGHEEAYEGEYGVSFKAPSSFPIREELEAAGYHVKGTGIFNVSTKVR